VESLLPETNRLKPQKAHGQREIVERRRGINLVAKQQERIHGTGAVRRESTFSWSTDARGDKSINANITMLDPGQSYAKQVKTERNASVDGNLMWSKAYDFSGALRSLQEFTYLTGSAYTQRIILNRVTG